MGKGEERKGRIVKEKQWKMEGREREVMGKGEKRK